MKTSGGFRSEADTQKMSSPLFFPSYPSTGLHNSEESSCGNVIVWWRWSKQCDRMLLRLPGWGPRHACHARVGLTLQVLIYAATLASKKWTTSASSFWKVLATTSITFSSDLGSWRGWCIFQSVTVYVYLLEDIDFFSPLFPPFLFWIEVNSPLCNPFYAPTPYSSFILPADTSDNTLLYYHLPPPSSIPSTITQGQLDSSTPSSFSFRKLIINGQFENRLESPQGCLPCQIEKGQGQVSRLAPCLPSWYFRGRRTRGNITNSPHAAGKAMAKDDEGGWRGSELRIFNI